MIMHVMQFRQFANREYFITYDMNALKKMGMQLVELLAKQSFNLILYNKR